MLSNPTYCGDYIAFRTEQVGHVGHGAAPARFRDVTVAS